jgi:hypothetical protein
MGSLQRSAINMFAAATTMNFLEAIIAIVSLAYVIGGLALLSVIAKALVRLVEVFEKKLEHIERIANAAEKTNKR